jgi:hypothetical protein
MAPICATKVTAIAFGQQFRRPRADRFVEQLAVLKPGLEITRRG